jgi:hypothetical protein
MVKVWAFYSDENGSGAGSGSLGGSAAGRGFFFCILAMYLELCALTSRRV